MRILVILLCAFLFWQGLCARESVIQEPYEPQAGDVLFQALPEWMMVTAIEAVTRSPYSHCGIVDWSEVRGGWVVLESWALAGAGMEVAGGVIETPLEEWLARCEDGHFVASRFGESSAAGVSDFLDAVRAYLGKLYDVNFDLDNDALYCSELIYRAYYDVAGVELVTPVAFGTLDWEPWSLFIRAVQKGTVPIERLVITPQQILDSPVLERVYQYGEPPPIAEAIGGATLKAY